MSQLPHNPSLRALCQDCLRAPTFSSIAELDAAHQEQLTCPCGGAYCACGSCLQTLEALEAGKRSAKECGLQHDITDWTAEGGVIA